MSLTSQITVYVTSLAALLTFMRLMSGITGSRPVMRSLLASAIYCAVALFFAGIAKASLNFSIMRELFAANKDSFIFASSLWFASWLFCVFYTFGLGVLLRIYVRNGRFQDWGTIANLRTVPPFTWRRSFKRWMKGDKKDYENTGDKRKQKALDILKKYLSNRNKLIGSHLVTGDDPWETRERIIEMCVELIQHTEEEINYVSIASSPSDIWTIFKEQAEKQGVALDKIKSRLVFIDTYTKVFGFRDDIVKERIRILKSKDSLEIVECDSASGIHSGTAKAFKILKASAKNENRTRRPCTMVYDTMSVLAMPETEKEVAEFVVHLSAAETAYGMVSIFLECISDKRSSSSKVLDAMLSCCGEPIKIEVS